MKIVFWGTRGSIPVPGKNTLKYGGNTPCVQIMPASGQEIILDAGSGIREYGKHLISNSDELNSTIIISHTHWDHIQGLPFFAPLFNPDYTIDIFLHKQKGKDISQIIKGQMNNYFFPVTADILPAKINFHEINEEAKLVFGDTEVFPKEVNHSPGTYAYKFVEDGKSVIYMTDNEIRCVNSQKDFSEKTISRQNRELIEFCSGADYLIHDTMYLENDYKENWGHSNDSMVALFSHVAKVKNLLLFHYNPDYDDKAVDNLVNKTNSRLRELKSSVNCIPSREGMKITV